jgi:hypothetical protein
VGGDCCLSRQSQVVNAALVEREAVTLALDHAFLELADEGAAAIEMQHSA